MRDSLQARIAAQPCWYHRIDLPGGVVTPGWAPLFPAAYRIPNDLTGLRVLDVGAWDGYWSFEAITRGASSVLAIEDFSDHIPPQKIGSRDWSTFDLCRDALGYSADKCQRETMSLYDLTPERHGMFDVIFFFGTLYHCRHPLLALDTLSAVCKNAIYVESATCNRASGYYGFRKSYSDQDVVAEFFPRGAFNQPTNYWMPTIECMAFLLQKAGWPYSAAWELTEQPLIIPECRGFAEGRKDRSSGSTDGKLTFEWRSAASGTTLLDDLKTVAPNPSVILDCGANVGQMAAVFRRLYPDAAIYAFEPVTAAYEKLQEAAVEMKVVPVKLALADYNGQTTINLTAGPESHSLLPYLEGNPCAEWTREIGTEAVEVCSLDQWCESNDIPFETIGLLKIDVQGAELQVLAGATKLAPTAILIEVMHKALYKGCPLYADIDNWMKEHGYKQHALYPSNQPENWADVLYVLDEIKRGAGE